MGIVRSGLMYGLLAVVITSLSVLVGGVPVGLGFSALATFLSGIGAGYTAAKTTRAFGVQRIPRGLAAGAIGGVFALLGSLLTAVLFVNLLRQQVAAWIGLVPFGDQIPLIGQIEGYTSPLLRGGGLVGGACLGVVNLLLMIAGGALGGFFWRR